MANWLQRVTVASSVLLRLSGFIFLRWIPGDVFPALIMTLAVVYVTGFTRLFLDLKPETAPLTTPPGFDIGGTTPIKRRQGPDGEDLPPFDSPTEALCVPPRGWRVSMLPGRYDNQDTIPLPKSIKTLLSGVPTAASRVSSIATLLVNVAICLMVLDLTFRAAWFYPANDLAFARLGYVSPTSASVLIRELDATKLPIHLSYRYADAPPSRAYVDTVWRKGDEVKHLDITTDWTAVLGMYHLEPDTRYQWITSNNHTGYVVTAPQPGHFSTRSQRTSVTEPIPGEPRTFTFLHSSCIIPHFPYNPLDHPLAIPGLSYLSRTLASLKPAFFLFLGDFIYIDVPRRHGVDVGTYRQAYRQVYASPDWDGATHVRPRGEAASYESYDLPWLHVWDDHEISNDWSRGAASPYAAALDPYTHYHLAANPPLDQSSASHGHNSGNASATWSAFNTGPASFFILDTRSFRSPPNMHDSSMLGAAQLSALLSWLKRPEPPGTRWKIVVSSVPFTRNWRVNGQDTWGGYLHERRRVLRAMWGVNSRAMLSRREGVGVVVLSGDRHEHATTQFPPPADGVDGDVGPEATVTEFSTSPLNMFYLPVRTYREDDPAAVSGTSSGSATGSGAAVKGYTGDERDVCIHYEPSGNSKFGAVSIESPAGSGQSVLRYRLFVDGRETWSYVLVAPERRSSGKGRERWREGVWN